MLPTMSLVGHETDQSARPDDVRSSGDIVAKVFFG